MTFTTEQMEVLAQYEGALRRAHYSRYCNALPKAAYNTLADIYDAAAGTKVQRNPNCQSCLFFLLDRLGAAYFAQKAIAEETAALEAEAAALAELQEEKPKTTTRSVKVAKTKRR